VPRGAIRVICRPKGSANEPQIDKEHADGNAGNVNEKPPLTTGVISGGFGVDVGPAGFEPTTSCTPSNQRRGDTPANLGNSATSPAGCTTGCTNSPPAVPEHPPSAVVSALLALMAQLSPADKATLAHLLLTQSTPKGDAE
jgi:hypothetical protein